MQVERIDTINRLFEIENIWTELLQKSRANDLFLTPEWIISWWKIFGSNRELYLLAFWIENELIGLVALYKYRRGIFHELTFVGLPDQSDRVDFIYKDGHEDECIMSCLNYLCDNVNWDVLNFRRLGAFTNSINILENALNERKLKYTSGIDGAYPYLDLKNYNGYDDYMMKYFKSKHRGNIRREGDKIRDVLKAKWTIRTQVEEKIVGEMVEIDVARSARGQIGNSYFKKDENRLFVNELMKRMEKNKYICLLTLNINDLIVAYSLAFNYNNKILNYQMSYDDKYYKEGIGVHTILHSIKYAIENKKDEYDLLLGEEEYKKRWSSSIRRSKYYIIYGNTYKSYVLYKYMKIVESMKRLIRKIQSINRGIMNIIF